MGNYFVPDPNVIHKATILYYAMGGGLGHLTRTFAILNQMGSIGQPIRILASSKHTALTTAYESFPIDIADLSRLCSRKAYLQYLKSYIHRHNVKMIVLDTFPWGIVGEWSAIFPNIPRVLVARALKWHVYGQRIGFRYGVWPLATLVLEPLEHAYYDLISRESRITELREPIIYQCKPESASSTSTLERRKSWLVVHSGDVAEQKTLKTYAKAKMAQLNCKPASLHTIFPHQDIYPAQKFIPLYGNIIGGAGYNMTALAAVAGSNQRFFLQPFHRRFDDQHARLAQFKSGSWHNIKRNGALQAAEWLGECIEKLNR